MSNFADLLSKPLDDIKRPPSLPQGTYFGTIKSYEPAESSKKKTPSVRMHFTLTHAGEDIDQAELSGIDLTKKQLSNDFYLTTDAEYRLKEFLESCGIKTEGRTFQSTLPESIGAAVMIDVVSKINPEKPLDPPFNQVKDVKGVQ